MKGPKAVIYKVSAGTKDHHEHQCSVHEIKSAVIEVRAPLISQGSTCNDYSSNRGPTKEAGPLLGSHNTLEMLNTMTDLATASCIATTKAGHRCTRSLSKVVRLELPQVLRSLIATGASYGWTTTTDRLEQLAGMLLCARSHRSSHTSRFVSSWKEKLACIPSVDVDLQIMDILLDSDGTAINSDRVHHKALTGASISKEGPTTFFTHFNERYEIRTFIPFDLRSRSTRDKDDVLMNAITRDLTKREIAGTGVIYVYWFPGNFGHLKIGVTTRAVEARLREWERTCGHRPHLLYPQTPAEQEPVPHIYRVEALVHAELHKFRRTQVRCKFCGKSHKEWFERSSEDAIATVKKWTAWMRGAPYAEKVFTDNEDKDCDDTRSLPEWILKSELTSSIQALCQPSPDDLRPPPSSSPRRYRPTMRRPSSNIEARWVNLRPRLHSPRMTRSVASKKEARSKSEGIELSRDVTDYPRFSDEFLKVNAYISKADRSISAPTLKTTNLSSNTESKSELSPHHHQARSDVLKIDRSSSAPAVQLVSVEKFETTSRPLHRANRPIEAKRNRN